MPRMQSLGGGESVLALVRLKELDMLLNWGPLEVKPAVTHSRNADVGLSECI